MVLALTNVFLDADGGGSLPKFFQGGEFAGGGHVGIAVGTAVSAANNGTLSIGSTVTVRNRIRSFSNDRGEGSRCAQQDF